MADNLWTQTTDLPIYQTAEATAGRTYIVTGSNTGLGLEAARHLVSLGAAKVIMAVRNVTSGNRAKQDIETTTGKTGIAEVWELDLSSYDSVKSFASKVEQQLERIDALIENAGVGTAMTDLSEGHPTPVTVNVYSTLLLAVLLLPKMKETALQFKTTPHIVVVTSTIAFMEQATWDLIKDDPNPVAKMGNEEAIVYLNGYSITKLLEMQAVRHLAPLIPVDRTGVVVNLVCPGLCKTELTRNAPKEDKDRIAQMNEAIGRTAECGSRNLLFAAQAGPDSHGKLAADCEIKDEKFTPDWVAGDGAKAEHERVWNAIAKEIERAAPGALGKVLGQ